MSPNPIEETPRSRMVRGAGQLIRERGIHGVGMRQVVEFSQTPRGSLQRYFPGGKAQLTAEAVLLATEEFPSGFPAALTADTLAEAVALTLAPWRRQLVSSDFGTGCPLMPIVVDGVDDDRLRTIAADAFTAWTQHATAMFERFGFDVTAAASTGLAFVGATEGAILLSRSRRDLIAMDAVESTFGSMSAPG
jgi:TetR/AcrR family transcriptional repressor of lmrAB and yxaGH operons